MEKVESGKGEKQKICSAPFRVREQEFHAKLAKGAKAQRRLIINKRAVEEVSSDSNMRPVGDPFRGLKG